PRRRHFAHARRGRRARTAPRCRQRPLAGRRRREHRLRRRTGGGLMRPLALTVEGLRSWRTRRTISFDRLGLFALIGDTGAGKSSLIEGLTLALYGGSTWSPQHGDLMSGGARFMLVSLRFAVGD